MPSHASQAVRSRLGAFLPRSFGLRSCIAALVLAVLLPILGFGGVASWVAIRGYRSASEARLSDVAGALAAAIDDDIEAHIAALRVLSASPDLDEGGDLAALYALARATGDIFQSWVIVYERDGRHVLNTLRPFGSPLAGPGRALAPGGGERPVARAFDTGEPVVSDLAVGRLTQRPSAVVFVPVIRNGVVRRVLGMALLPERLSALLAGQAGSADGVVTLTDSQGFVVARSRDAEWMLGRSRPSRQDAEPLERSGLLSGQRLDDGEPIKIAYRRLSTALGWVVWVNEPQKGFWTVWRGPILAIAGGATVALALGLGLGIMLARQVLRPVSALARRAEVMASARLALDTPLPAVPASPVTEFEVLRLATERADAALREAERRYRILFDSAPFGIIVFDPETLRILDVSDRACAEYGYDRQHFLRLSIADLDALPDSEVISARGRSHAAGADVQEFEARHRTRSGALRDVLVRVQAVRLNEREVRYCACLDITAHRSAVAALRVSEARLRLTAEGVQVGIWDLDLVTGRGRWSPAAMALLGTDRDSFTIEAWLEAIHPEDREVARLAWERAVACDEAYEVEYRTVRPAPDGGERWLLVRGRAERDADGYLVRGAGVLLDVTARRRAEEAMRASEAQLRLALDAGRMAVWSYDVATKTVKGSPELNRLLGFPPEATPSLEEMQSRYYRGEGERIQAIAQAALAQGERFFEAEYRYVWPGGAIRWLMLRAEFHFDQAGQPVRVLGVLLDVTDHRQAEETLRESEERLVLAQEAGDVGTWEWDPQSRALRWSRLTHLLFGLDPDRDVTPSLDSLFAAIHEEDRQYAREAFFRATEAGSGEFEFRILRPTAEGRLETRWLFSRGRSIPGADGRPGRFLGATIDITDRKLAEERQRLLMCEVDHRAKNALAVVQAALRLTRRDEPEAYARAVEGRVRALARAHSLLAEGRWSGAELRELVESELAPFLHSAGDAAPGGEPRVSLAGGALLLPPATAQGLAMVLHELATNATKHGALSAPTGRVTVTWSVRREDGLLRLSWTERGGPAVPAAPSRRGFGSRVLETVVSSQLGGQVERRWEAEGLTCLITVPVQLVRGNGTAPPAPASLEAG